jgi:hypothetical protein
LDGVALAAVRTTLATLDSHLQSVTAQPNPELARARRLRREPDVARRDGEGFPAGERGGVVLLLGNGSDFRRWMVERCAPPFAKQDYRFAEAMPNEG